jgi:uncharacterized protein (DUF2141 family)
MKPIRQNNLPILFGKAATMRLFLQGAENLSCLLRISLQIRYDLPRKCSEATVSKAYPISTRSVFVAALLLSVITNGASFASESDSSEIDHVSCTGKPLEIRITVSGVPKSVGVVSADLYPNDEDSFLKGPKRLARTNFAAVAPKTTFCMTAPMPGDYVVSVYHDQDADGVFDKNALGLPAEPWGLSNNPKVLFSLPPIEKTLFHVDGAGASIEIKLKN